jgi:protocatechuate 3,4-dioxygenase beta subunit
MRLLLVLLLAAALAAGCDRSPAAVPASSTAAPAPAPAAAGGSSCGAGYEEPDTLSPSYRPGAPVRAVVGTGHVLTGTVRSGRDCAPIAGARVELWPEIAGRGHPDDQRATVLTGPDGRYRFQSDPPEHIHMLVSATGFEPVASNRYHPEGRAAGRFDVVLPPSPP